MSKAQKIATLLLKNRRQHGHIWGELLEIAYNLGKTYDCVVTCLEAIANQTEVSPLEQLPSLVKWCNASLSNLCSVYALDSNAEDERTIQVNEFGDIFGLSTVKNASHESNKVLVQIIYGYLN